MLSPVSAAGAGLEATPSSRPASPSSRRRAATRSRTFTWENIMTRIKLVAAVGLAAATTTAAWSQETIKIGGLLETSGFIASLGQPGLEGAMLAVEQTNAKGGIAGKKLELININTESDNTKTVSAVKRLTEQDKIAAIVGPMNSGSSFASIDTVQRSETAMISNGGSRGIVLPAADKKWIFLAPLTDVLVQSVMLSDMKKKGIRKIALLNSDTPFGTSGREQLEKNAGSYGVTVVMQQTFGNDDKDITPQLTKIRGSDAEATVVWATGPGMAIAVKNHRQLGIKTPVYLAHSANDFNFLRLAGEAANDVLIPSSKIYVIDSLSANDPQKPVLQGFVRDYQAKYNKLPATFAGNGYDATMMIAEAIGKAGTDRAKIRDSIEGLKNHVGVTAVYSYSPEDHFGAQADSVVMLVVKDGKFALAAR
jgi:branched-chain amino acid transport system substrate-binding protein